MKFLFIGDPHIKNDNGDDVDILLLEIHRIFNDNVFDKIIIGGDIMHYHEKVFTPSLNKSLSFIKSLSELAYTYVIVGNHDYENNSQFLTQNHWLNALKEWKNVKIVDDVVVEKDFIIVPYVFPGRFIEAIETKISNDDWIKKKVIFAHQEFKGCNMGAIVSEDGDEWLDEFPQIISGHIHDNQKVGSNIYYPGTPLQHSFGDSDIRIVCGVQILDEGVVISDFPLRVPRKHIIKADLKDLKKMKHDHNNGDKIKIKLDSSPEEFKLFKETKEYKDLIDSGVKIQLQKQKNSITDTEKETGNFIDILDQLVSNDEILVKKIYDEIILNKIFIDV